jgi:hypothetical protein
MKKIFFGLTFLGSVLMFNQGAKAQASLGICCQEKDSFCQDRFGNAYADSIEKPGPFCP